MNHYNRFPSIRHEARQCQHGRQYGICGECWPAEPTVDRDRELDQTAKTDDSPRRHVSPAILEQRIICLTRDLRLMEIERDRLRLVNRALHKRIEGFEKMSATLANKIDQIFADLKLTAADAHDQATGDYPRAA